MKNIKLLCCLFLVICCSINVPFLAAEMMTINTNTILQVRLLQDISSKTAVSGERVVYEVLRDVYLNGKIVFKQGASASGQVLISQPAGRVGGAGNLSFNITSVQAVDETQVPVNISRSIQGQSKMGTSVVVSILCCILGLLIKGEEAVAVQGLVLEVQTSAPISIQVK